MRVLYFSRDYTPHDHRFLTAIAESGHEVFYLRLEKRGHQREDRLLPQGVTRINWAGGGSQASFKDGWKLLRGLRKTIRQIRPDILHAGPVPTVGLLAALSGFHPLVSMSWGSDLLIDAGRNRFWGWAASYALKRSDVLLTDCETVTREALKYGIRREKVVSFPWGVDLGHFSPGDETQLRTRLGWEEAYVLLQTRSWEPLYGVDVLARAFVTAAQANPELRFLFLGSGSQAGLLRKIFMSGGVLDRVHFGGQVKLADLPAYYRTADLYLSASHSDGSSVSLMEALACGTPALVSDIPANLEWVSHAENGWLFPDGDVQTLAECILELSQNRKRTDAARKKSRKVAEQRADWSQNIEKLMQAYKMAAQVSA